MRLPSQAATEPDLLSVTENGVSIGAHMLEVKGQRGMSVSGSVSLSQLSGHPSQDLHLRAPSGSLQAQGAQGVALEAAAGGLTLTAGGDLRIQSSNGPVSAHTHVINCSCICIEACYILCSVWCMLESHARHLYIPFSTITKAASMIVP